MVQELLSGICSTIGQEVSLEVSSSQKTFDICRAGTRMRLWISRTVRGIGADDANDMD